ncbi:hypothetical protein [Methanoregula sp. UBA64]|jgi:hypothetical protein|uniref:hypothetical protein n=1 Tax=Methanoregula sp. UBA64 TaxID=1915554 RepID=UPI0025D10AE5|nr:hypothetical protein [Methanoregula sp. UBA64]
MNIRHTPVILALCVVLLLAAAGCTGTTTPALPFGPTATPTPVPTTAPVSTLPTLSPTPSPTEALPDVWAVDVQVQSNGQAINPQVIMTFRGGMGMNLIPELDLEVIRSDGVVETGTMKQPLYVGKTVSLQGTTQNNDRAVVWAITPQGDRVKIIDQYVPFRSYN